MMTMITETMVMMIDDDDDSDDDEDGIGENKLKD